MPLLLSLSPRPLMKAGMPHRGGSSLLRPLADLTCPELADICTHPPQYSCLYKMTLRDSPTNTLKRKAPGRVDSS